MNRKERTAEKVEELFHIPAAGDEGTDPEFMQILQGFIFGDVCYVGSLDNRMRELVTITVLTTLSTLPQLDAHVQAGLNAGCTPMEIREAIYQCAPFIGFPKTLNAIQTMNQVFARNNIPLPLPSQGNIQDSQERYEKGLALQAPLYGDEIARKYTWLPGEFAQAVPRFLTQLCFGDFYTRSGLDGKTRELLTVVLLAALGGRRPSGKKPPGRSPESRKHPGRAGLCPGPCQRIYGLSPSFQCPECRAGDFNRLKGDTL